MNDDFPALLFLSFSVACEKFLIFFFFSSLFRIGWPTFLIFDQKLLENISCLKPSDPFLLLQGRIIRVPFSHGSDQEKTRSCTCFLTLLLAAGTRLSHTTVSEPPEGSVAKAKYPKTCFSPETCFLLDICVLWELLRVVWGRSLVVS